MLHSSSLVFIGADAVKKKLVETFFKASTILLPFWLLKVDVVVGPQKKGPFSWQQRFLALCSIKLQRKPHRSFLCKTSKNYVVSWSYSVVSLSMMIQKRPTIHSQNARKPLWQIHYPFSFPLLQGILQGPFLASFWGYMSIAFHGTLACRKALCKNEETFGFAFRLCHIIKQQVDPLPGIS